MPHPESSPDNNSIRAQFASWWRNLPIVSKSVLAVCVTCYVLSLTLLTKAVGRYCYDGSQLFSDPLKEASRGLSSPFFHLSLLHIVFNMLAFLPTGAHVERTVGSLVTFSLVLGLIVASALLNGLLASALAFLTPSSFTPSCAAGFSGIIFGLICIDNHATDGHRRSIYGMFEVPKALYPWVLLLLIQLLAPQVSFLGHLSGLLAGELYARGLLSALVLSAPRAAKLEASPLLGPLLRLPSYVASTGTDLAGLLVPGLPLTHAAGGGSSGSGGFPMPGTILRGGYGFNVFGSSGETQQATSGPFRGQGRTLGGSGAPATAAAQAALDRRGQQEGAGVVGYASLSGGPPVAILTPGTVPPSGNDGVNPFAVIRSDGAGTARGS